MEDENADAEAVFTSGIERLRSQSERLAIGIAEHLGAASTKLGGNFSASKETKSRISRRALNVERYATADGLPVLLSMDVSSVCDHIVNYPYIPRYRRMLKDDNVHGRGALVAHLHSLTGGEMYTVLERGSRLIRDAHFFAKDCGLSGVDSASSFEKAFRKRFDYVLRERHRMAHAHEAPSMRARAVNVVQRARDLPPALVRAVLGGMVSRLAEQMTAAGVDRSEFWGRVSTKGQEQRFMSDAEDALRLLAEHLNAAVGVERAT